MAVNVVSREEYGTLSRNIYTDTEIRTAWLELNGQGNREARSYNRLCVVKECTEPQALALSRVFIDRFAMPTCCHYNGKELSMYCGAAGGGFQDLYEYINALEVY